MLNQKCERSLKPLSKSLDGPWAGNMLSSVLCCLYPFLLYLTWSWKKVSGNKQGSQMNSSVWPPSLGVLDFPSAEVLAFSGHRPQSCESGSLGVRQSLGTSEAVWYRGLHCQITTPDWYERANRSHSLCYRAQALTCSTLF